MSAPRAILHVDMDAFYASVEQRDRPELRGQPLIVGGTSNRGVVAAASYEVRKFGVRSAMPIREALRRCPHAICVKPRMSLYRDVSREVFAIFHEYTPVVEGLSLDEAFLDVTATEHLFGGAEKIARDLKSDVRSKLGLVLSVGLATNKLCAKIGSDLRKPDGLVIVPPGTERAFLAPLELQRLWGVGPKTREVLEGWGMRTIGDLAEAGVAALEAKLGEHGRSIWERANGIDEGTVESDMAPKSVGHEHTFDRDTLNMTTVESTLLRLSEGVGQRLRAQDLRGKTVTLKLRVAPFETRSRQRTLADATDDDLTIYRVGRQLLRDALGDDHARGRTSPVRLVGVSVSGLEAGRQLGLFDHARVTRLNAALDAVRARFGDDALDRASARNMKERRRFSGYREKRES